MGKYVIDCPRCRKPLQVSTGLFAKNKISCPHCTREIDLALEKMAEETCPRCGGRVVYDRTKPNTAVCPTCHTNIKSGEVEQITCPSCSAQLTVDKNARTCTCPQCKSAIDVQSRLAQKESSKHAQVIRWEGEKDVFIYRHPMENFKLGSRLIVKEGQKAIFFRNGQALDVFGPGAHMLETQNLPLIEEILKYPTDADLTFSSQVYFIKTEGFVDVYWSIPNMELRNPGMNFYVKVGALGSAKMRIMEGNENAKKFLTQVIGTAFGGSGANGIAAQEKYDNEYLEKEFRDIIITRIGSLFADLIVSSNINILDLAPKKAQISDLLLVEYNKILVDYGLEIPPMRFMVTDIKIQPSAELEKWKQQEADRVLNVRDEDVLRETEEARRARVLAEDQTKIQRDILKAQGDVGTRKITAQGDADISMLRAQTSADISRLDAQAGADVARLDAQGFADATIISTQANAQATILSSQADAEATRLTGQASAEAYRAQAIAEADEMHAKGYTYEQETSRQIGMEALKNGLPGTGTGGGGGISIGGGSSSKGSVTDALGDMVGLGVSLSAMGSVVNMTKDIVSPVMTQISEIGKQATAPITPAAPQTNLVSAWNCTCGKSCITSKFCPECGSPKPVAADGGTWNCTCGQTGITSNFCPNCGARKPAVSNDWNCPNCGQTGITSNFCPNCGSRKGV